MDINALLSPDESQQSSESPTSSPLKRTSRPRLERPSGKRTGSGLSQEVTRSPERVVTRPSPPDSNVSHSTRKIASHPQQQQTFSVQHGTVAAPNYRPLPPTSAPHREQQGVYGYVQPLQQQQQQQQHQDRPAVAHRHSSTPQMETLADLASMRQRQQTTRTYSANNVRSDNKRLSINTPVHNLAAPPAGISISRQSLADLTMAEAPSQTPPPRDFTSHALSDEESKAVTELLNFLAENSYAYDQHVQLINLLHKGFLSHVCLPAGSADGTQSGDPRTYALVDELRQAREAMDTRFAVGEAIWKDWLADEVLLARDSGERIGLIELFDRAVQDEPASVDIWQAYVDWVQTNYAACYDVEGADLRNWTQEDLEMCKELFNQELLKTVLERAVDPTQWRIDSSHLLWNRHAQIVGQDVPEQPSEDDIRLVHSLFVERLKTPHAAKDETMQQYWPFINKFEGSNWEAAVDQVNHMSEPAKAAYMLREDHEVKLLRAVESGDADATRRQFDKYLKSERYAHKKPGPFDYDLRCALYERALLRFPTATEWWLDYVDFILTDFSNESRSLLPVIERATRHCPWSGDLWARRILRADVEHKSREEIENTKHRATNAGLLDVGGMEELVKMLQQWCSYLRRHAFRPTSTEDDVDTAEVGITMALEDVQQAGTKTYGIGFQGDPLFRLEQVQIKFYTQARRFSDARNIYRQLVMQHGGSYDFWAKYYNWELWFWGHDRINDTRRMETAENGPDFASAVCREALHQRTIDWPDKLLEMYLYHFQQHESGAKLQVALAAARDYANRLTVKRTKEAEETAALVASQQQELSAAVHQEAAANGGGEKRKRDDELQVNGDGHKRSKTAETTTREDVTKTEPSASASAQVKRDRENNTITIRNLPVDVGEVDIKKFFRDCGHPPSINILRDNDTASATVEFETEEDVLAAKTRNGKELNGREVRISSGSQSTLYITNYPEAYDENLIRGLFENYGEIVSIRLPSLKFNSRRRFCYVQFLTTEDAKAAEAAMDGKKLDGLHTLTAKISNPDAAKQRGGAKVEGREVFARNLDRDQGESKIKEHFAQFGTLERAHLIRKPNDEMTGTGFFVYASNNEANAAVAGINNKPFGDRIVHAEMSNSKGRAAPTERAHKEDIIVKKSGGVSASPEPSGRRGSDLSMPDAKPEYTGNSKARKIAVFNIPDTVNDARIRTTLEKYGAILKIQLRRDKAGAIVEYESVKDAFNVHQGVDVTSLGPEAKTGDVGDLLALGKVKKRPASSATIGSSNAPARNASLAFVPSAASRPGRGGGNRGGIGGRRGMLGFKRGGGASNTAAPSASSAPSADADGKKSNNDFRSMLEASKKGMEKNEGQKRGDE
ncbi:hypothetical protein DOTSEDRAFT_78563 [Dothistroma septosporum NZE10]|uniref:U4/U6 snRNA-associated-splicing factor PRP24 n=1 Tax=Dothistroma septosporum (strain NZE10 / CBS 128990) TaxID=675120 RepID=N1PV33_DOTSN|nr:hypothetical protein DOTSEDRAFT_78563 [Dothistroma septosporum NZE10]